MILSRSADYALRALMYLAQHGRERPVTLHEIALAQGVPAALLSKLLQALVKADVLRSHRGHGGGFVLVRDPATVTLEAVIEAIDGPLTVFECLEDEGFCRLCPGCTLRRKLGELRATIGAFLASVSVADCVPGVLPSAAPSG